MADGHLGIWSALGEVFPDGAEQRCWNHRLTNVIDHLPKKEWSAAKELLRKMPYALSRAECERLRDQFATRYGVVRNFVFEPVVDERSSRVKRLLTTC